MAKKPVPAGAFGVSAEELEMAKQCAIKAAVKYGDDVGAQLDKIRAGHIWNDHVAVQAAVETIKRMKEVYVIHRLQVPNNG